MPSKKSRSRLSVKLLMKISDSIGSANCSLCAVKKRKPWNIIPTLRLKG